MMKNNATYFKWSIILIIILVLLWFARSCRGGNETVKEVTVIDTVWVVMNDTVVISKPVPYAVYYPVTTVDHDTLTNIEFINTDVDSFRILSQYFAERYYDTTVQINYGNVTLRDTVSQNRITGRSLFINQHIPEVTKTITVGAQRRNILYFGIEAIGNADNIPFASGASFGLKLKNDAMIEVKGLLTQDRAMYGFGLKFPIKLKKR
jgi:hypothetical protein